MSGIVLATNDASFEARVRQAFDHRLNGELRAWQDPVSADDLDATAAGIAADAPAVVAIGPEVEVQAAIGLARTLGRDHPEISLVLVAEPSPQLLSEALRAGVRDVVAPDTPPGELQSAIERALEAAERCRANLAGRPSDTPATPERHTVMVLSAKGGAGKTTMATNLAVGLAQASPRQVVIVDLDLQFGDVANALNLIPEYTIVDACRAGADRDLTTLKVFLTPHPSGLYALCAPDSPVEADEVSEEAVARIVRALSNGFRYVVLDTGSGMDDAALAAIDEASDFVLVCATDVPTVRGVRKELEALDLIGATTQRRILVLNRADADVGLAPDDIAETIGLRIDVSVPSSRAIPLAMNHGAPLLESDEPRPEAAAMSELVRRFADVPARPARPRMSLFSRRKKS